MSFYLTLPKKTIIGEGALEQSEKALAQLGKKALVVSDNFLAKTGTLMLLTDRLKKWGMRFEVFSDIAGEPTDKMIQAGVEAFQTGKCDFLIAIGGGSSLDSAKAIAAMTMLQGHLRDFMGKEIEGRLPPTVLIPTTAGTGSEATKFTIITDTERDVKMLLKGDVLLPELAIIDYSLTITAPPGITAATGMDALTHAVEAYTSRKANAFTDTLALSAIQRIFRYLPTAFRDGENRKAREEMALAAYEAGICINNASVTLVHGMSRPIGALFHVPHGISNAMLLRPCLEYVLDGCHARFAVIARAIGTADADISDWEAAETFIQALDRLIKEIEIPTLGQYGINKEQFDLLKDKMAGDAMASGSPANTIKEIKKEDLLAVYSRVW